MLSIDIGRLEREGSLAVDAELPADAPLWEGSELVFDEPVAVRGTVSLAGSGEVIFRGEVKTTLRHQCRRCLDPVKQRLDEEMTFVFSPQDELGSSEADPETRIIDPTDDEIDLGEAIREELILDIDRFAVCDPGCRGLCPLCGVNQNEEECDCTLEEEDPRWDALRALREDGD